MCRLLLLAAVLALLAACGSGGVDRTEETGRAQEELPSDPGEVMLQFAEYDRNGQWARQWEHLHPAHQELASREAFLTCKQGNAISFDSSRVIEVFEETVPIPRIGEVNTTAITMELSVEIGNGERSERVTSHLLDVDGAWRWVLSNDALDAFEVGDCP